MEFNIDYFLVVRKSTAAELKCLRFRFRSTTQMEIVRYQLLKIVHILLSAKDVN